MHAKLRKLREERANGDHGFTLIELLVVVVIIGILVAIAIPVYLNFRKGAENRSAQSDVRNAVTAIEQCFNERGQVYPKPFKVSGNSSGGTITIDCSPGDNQIVNVSTGNQMVYRLTKSRAYTIGVRNSDTGDIYTYTNANGLIVKNSRPDERVVELIQG